MSRRTLIVAILVPLLLLVLVVAQLFVGGNALPIWIASIAQGRQQDPLIYLRGLIVLELIAAIFLIFFGRRLPLAGIVVLVCIAFVSLAECSAAVRRELLGSVTVAAIIFTISLCLCFALMRTQTPKKSEAATSVAPIGILAMAVLILATAGVAMNLPLAPRTFADGAPLRATIQNTSQESRIIELAPESWLGMDLSETVLGRFVPDVKDVVGTGHGVVVLYNPRCGTCHDLFDVYFSEGVDLPVAALLVPPSEQEVVIPSEYPEEVNCPGCEMMSLPNGPLWLVQPPVVLGVTDGVVTCVATDDPTPCFKTP